MDSIIEKKDPVSFNTNEVPRVTFFKEGSLTKSLMIICSRPSVESKLIIAVKAKA
jgi:hypothetical protein